MKKAFLRGLLGFPLGVFLGYTITIIISLVLGSGEYMAVAPELEIQCASQIGAVILQYALCGLIGAASAAGSTVWQVERWGILKQTVIHFLILSLTILPVAYLAHWMEHSFAGFASYFAIFIAIYALLWAVLYFIWKKKIRQMNEKIQENKRDN